MKEPTAEKLAEYSDVHLELLICSYAHELRRRNPRKARAMAGQLKLMMHDPQSNLEPFPAADTSKEDEERYQRVREQMWGDTELVDHEHASWDSIINGGTGTFARKGE